MAKQAPKPNPTTQENAGTTTANSDTQTGATAASEPIAGLTPATAPQTAPAVQFIAIPNAEPETFAATLTRQAMVNGKIRKAGSSVRVGAELLEELETAGLIA